MPIFGFIFLTPVALVALGIGVVIATVVVVAIIALVSAGILSSSVLAGLTSRSAFTGVRLAMLQVLVVVGGAAGARIGVLCEIVFDPHVGIRVAAAVGLGAGLVAGVVVGMCLDVICRILIRRFMPIRGFEAVVQVIAVEPTA